MSRVSQDELQAAVLHFLFEYMDGGGAELAATDVAKLMQGGFPESRVKMALTTLEGQGVVNARYNTITGATYKINDSGYRQIEEILAVTRSGASPDVPGQAPASDRVVSLDHNQIAGVQTPLDEFLAAVEGTNGDPDEPSFRQRIVGQIKAARELIRAGEYRAYLLQITLVAALNEIIVKYKDGVIVGLATNLLQYIITNGLTS